MSAGKKKFYGMPITPGQIEKGKKSSGGGEEKLNSRRCGRFRERKKTGGPCRPGSKKSKPAKEGGVRIAEKKV